MSHLTSHNYLSPANPSAINPSDLNLGSESLKPQEQVVQAQGVWAQGSPPPHIPASFAELARKYPPQFIGTDAYSAGRTRDGETATGRGLAGQDFSAQSQGIVATESDLPPLEQPYTTAHELDAIVTETFQHLLAQSTGFDRESARDYLAAQHPHLPAGVGERVLEEVQAHVSGLGRLEPLLKTPGITDIYVNAPDQVWTDGSGGLQPTRVRFADEAEVRALATRLITSAGARLDDAVPANDVQNSRGQRIHAVLPPVVNGCTALSIRLQPAQRLSFEQWMAHEPDDLATVLRYLVETKANLLVSGGTGSGKTTLLNALLGLCDRDERLITLEDSPELDPDHPHVVALLTKDANAEGRGAVSLQDLLQQSLRMGPDRLVLGESRGAEVVDLLMAMNTGHSGSGSTVHANSARAVPARLLAMGALGGLSMEATSLQAATALDYIIHCIKGQDVRRHISEIARLCLEDGKLVAVPCCRVEPAGTGSDAPRQLHWLPTGQQLRQQSLGSASLAQRLSDERADRGKHEAPIW